MLCFLLRREVKGSDTSVYVLLYMLDGRKSDVTDSAAVWYNARRRKEWGLVKTRRLARHSLRSACSLPHGSRTPARGGYAMNPPSQRLRRTGKQQRAIHLCQGYDGLKAGMWKSVRKDVPRSLASRPGKRD